MKVKQFFMCIVVAVMSFGISANGAVEFNSGEYEPVNYNIYDTISIDDVNPDFAPDPGTHLDLLHEGTITGAVYSYNNTQFTLNGGSVYGRLFAHDNSFFDLKEGSWNYSDGNIFFVYENSIVNLYGTNFTVNEQTVAPGDSLKDYVEFNGTFYRGSLEGELLNGSAISGDFFIYNNADMVFIPEPATLSLLTLGGLALIRKK